MIFIKKDVLLRLPQKNFVCSEAMNDKVIVNSNIEI